MKAVNLIPADARKRGGGVPNSSQLATYGLFGLLGVVLALVVYYVTASNTVSSRQAQLTTLRAEVAQAQARVSSLGTYTQFRKLAQARIQTVEGIAATRFDWHSALSDLTRVVPSNTSLQSLQATVAPGATSGGGAGAGGGASTLRTNVTAPAFELVGCTASQDDVAKLMARLRLIDGVTRVTLGSSAKSTASQGGASVSAGGAQGCGPNKPTFDVVVFFRAVPGAGPTGATSLGTVTTPGGTK